MKNKIQLDHHDVLKMTYDELLKSPQWIKKRKLILDRDNNKCLNCNSQKRLHVHHRQYRYNSILGGFVNPWEYDNKFLITLCESCHKKGHDLYKVPVININN